MDTPKFTRSQASTSQSSASLAVNYARDYLQPPSQPRGFHPTSNYMPKHFVPLAAQSTSMTIPSAVIMPGYQTDKMSANSIFMPNSRPMFPQAYPKSLISNFKPLSGPFHPTQPKIQIEEVSSAAAKGKLVTDKCLDDLVKKMDPMVELDDDVKYVLKDFVDEFVDKVVTKSADLAKLCGSKTIRPSDVKFVLENIYKDG